jgi:uncharacterized membrane protein YagU involved in acid resistance
VHRILAGLIGGLAGTTAMTAAMVAMHRHVPPADRYALPPRRVAMAMARKSTLVRDRRALTIVAHYGYGVSLGGAYGLLAPRSVWAPAVAGLPFGLAVWMGSYLGWLPAAGLYPPATRESAPRNALMITAHLVWAGVMGIVVSTFDHRDRHESRRSAR